MLDLLDPSEPIYWLMLNEMILKILVIKDVLWGHNKNSNTSNQCTLLRWTYTKDTNQKCYTQILTQRWIIRKSFITFTDSIFTFGDVKLNINVYSIFMCSLASLLPSDVALCFPNLIEVFVFMHVV